MRKIIFLDRDGVINKDPGGWTPHNYVTRWDDFVFLPGSKRAIKKLNESGYDIIVISNQAGISKGHYTKRALNSVNANMLKEIRAAGGRIRKVYYCIHQDSDNCDCRKPKVGLFKWAEKDLGIEARNTYFIGDAKADIEAGKKMKLKTILVLSGKTRLEDIDSWELRPDYIFDNLLQAVQFIVGDNG